MEIYQEGLIDFYSKNNHPPELHESIFKGTQYIGQIDFWSADEISRFGTLLGLNEHSRLLDMGTGLGGPLCYLVEKYRCYGVGVEVSTNNYLNAVNRSKELGLADRIEMILDDVNNICVESNSIDAIIFIDSIVHMNRREQILKSCKSYLKKHGKVLITLECITKDIPLQLKEQREQLGHVMLDTEENYKKLFNDCGFTVEVEEKYKTKRGEFAEKAINWMKETNHLDGLASMETIYKINQMNYAKEYLFVLE